MQSAGRIRPAARLDAVDGLYPCEGEQVTRDDIIRWARKVGWTEYSLKHPVESQRLYRFAALVAEAERELMTVNSIHTCHPECDRPGCVAVRKAVEAEREAICPIVYGLCISDNNAQEIVNAIRARGSK